MEEDLILLLTERVARPGEIVVVEDVFSLTGAGVAYLLQHSLADAPGDARG